MRRDLFIGLFAALAFHVGVFWLGDIYSTGPVKAKVKQVEKAIEIKMPPIEPDPPEPQDTDQDQPPPDIPPPQQQDVPQIVTDNSFVQQLEPPPPQNLEMTKGIITIPKNTGDFRGMKVFNIADLDEQAEPRFQPKPIYPADMNAQHISGTVVVQFIVDSNGDVQNAYAKSSTRREFESSAVTAVRKWKFRPGRKAGHAVAFRMEIPIEFVPPPGD
jgi:protein TonB